MRNVILATVVLALGLAATAAGAANPPAPTPEVQKLGVALGHWLFRGETLAPPNRRAATFTWDEDCRWSANRTFLACSFTNVWAGRLVKSLVVDTYNPHDRAYWHYELFADGNGARPFISKMTVSGDTWIESSDSTRGGKTVHERIVYRWLPPNRVGVKIQTSADGLHWTTLDHCTGVKQP